MASEMINNWCKFNVLGGGFDFYQIYIFLGLTALRDLDRKIVVSSFVGIILTNKGNIMVIG